MRLLSGKISMLRKALTLDQQTAELVGGEGKEKGEVGNMTSSVKYFWNINTDLGKTQSWKAASIFNE